jgi:hypothetical protein
MLAARPRRSRLSILAVRRWTIVPGTGSLQSEVIAFQSTGTRPIWRAVRSTAGRRAPKGGRKKRMGAPVICWRVSVVRVSCARMRGVEVSARLGWLQE